MFGRPENGPQGAVGKRTFEKEAGRKLRKHGVLASREALLRAMGGQCWGGVWGLEERRGAGGEDPDWEAEHQGKVQDHLLVLMGRNWDQEDVERSGGGRCRTAGSWARMLG